jgi:hypothetical protein
MIASRAVVSVLNKAKSQAIELKYVSTISKIKNIIPILALD